MFIGLGFDKNFIILQLPSQQYQNTVITTVKIRRSYQLNVTNFFQSWPKFALANETL